MLVPGAVLQSLVSLNVADLVGLLVVSTGVWKAWVGRPRALLRRGRVRHLGPLGVARSATRARVDALLRGEPSSPAQELNWLARALRLDVDQAVTYQDADRASVIAAAYAGYAAELDAGTLLGANRAPVVRSESERAHALSRMVKPYGELDTVGHHDEASSDILEVPHRRLKLSFFGASAVGTSCLGPQHLYVSYRDTRLYVRPTTKPADRPAKALQVPPDVLERLNKEFTSKPTLFDGALPRLIESCSVQDARTGRRGLHLSLAETTYGAWVVDHYPLALTEDGSSRLVSGDKVRGLTLSSVVLTQCGHLLFTRRSRRSGSHQGLLGPAINGNLEFDPRRGLSVDLDEDHLPDLRAALLREAREELGLTLNASQLTVTGLGRFSVPREVGTYVLLSCTSVELDRTAVAVGLHQADPIEGAWENDYSLVSLPVPRTTAGRKRAIDWLVGSTELTPHATAAGLGALSLALRDDSILETALRCDGITSPVARPPDVEQYAPGRGWAHGEGRKAVRWKWVDRALRS